MFDLFFGYRFYQTRVIYDRIRKGGKKKEMKNFSHRETFSWANMATKEWHLFLFYTRKFSRLATYYVTYIRSSNDTSLTRVKRGPSLKWSSPQVLVQVSRREMFKRVHQLGYEIAQRPILGRKLKKTITAEQYKRWEQERSTLP